MVTVVQLGSEILPLEIQEHWKSGLFEDWISNGLVLKESGYSFRVPTIQKPEHSKI